MKLGGDDNPAAAAVALTRLVEIDIKLLLPLLPTLLTSPDAAVRGFGVEALFRLPNDDRIQQLGDRLADPNPDVRSRARRRALRELASQSELHRVGNPGRRPPHWPVATGAEEQGAVLLGQLDHKPACKRMLELLSVQRPKALIAAAWGLRQVAVESTLPEVLDFVGKQHDRFLAHAERQRHPAKRSTSNFPNWSSF